MIYGYVYILRCKDNSLYTGWCRDLKSRVKLHNEGKGAKYTRSHGPCKLVYYEEIDNMSQARQRENAIKRMSKVQKEDLVKDFKLN